MATVLDYELIDKVISPLDGEAEEKFKNDIEKSRVLDSFRRTLRDSPAVPRSDDDPSVAPILVKITGEQGHNLWDSEWHCPKCASKIGDYDSRRGATQANADYCPECGLRLAWPAVSKGPLRIRSFLLASDVFGYLDLIEDSEIAGFLRSRFNGSEHPLHCSATESLPPLLMESSSVIFTDSFNDSGELSGEIINRTEKQYHCPVCDWPVENHGFPFTFIYPGYHRTADNFCCACGQQIDWTKITLEEGNM